MLSVAIREIRKSVQDAHQEMQTLHERSQEENILLRQQMDQLQQARQRCRISKIAHRQKTTRCASNGTSSRQSFCEGMAAWPALSAKILTILLVLVAEALAARSSKTLLTLRCQFFGH